mgnify:CR=1 FL=1
MKLPCIVTGKLSYFSKDALKKKLSKFGTIEEFIKHYISPPARKLLRKGMTVEEIREELNVQESLPKVSLDIISRLSLLKNKSTRKNSADIIERDNYLNSKEFKDKMRAVEERKNNMTYQDWVYEYTGTGRARGGTCIRPDIFLSWNDRSCDGCQCFEYCLCYQKRLSHEKKKPRLR